MIDRIRLGIDHRLRKKQAEFRSGRGTTEQIFILCNILEQVNEWQATLYISFIDFEKAFDSVHRNGLWMIMNQYGIPQKIINIVKGLYDAFECAVVEEDAASEWFALTIDVKQGCTLYNVWLSFPAHYKLDNGAYFEGEGNQTEVKIYIKT